MKKESKQILKIIIRYILILLVAIPNFYLFYKVFTLPTTYLSYLLFQIFFSPRLIGGSYILLENILIEIIPACVAGLAYFLLFALNLSVPGITLRRRVNSIVFSFASLLALNVLRIFLLGNLKVSGLAGFESLHLFSWFFLSTIFVVGIWFLEIKIFKIKGIPVYEDLKVLYEKSSFKKSK